MKEPLEIPFKKGDQQHYPEDYPNSPVNWLQNFEFDDTLIFEDYARGRSAAYFIFRRQSNNKKVTVFLKDFTGMISHLVQGSVTGRFTFCKRGSNFGCKLL